LNQHRDDHLESADQLKKEFGDRVMAIGRILPMLEKWDDAGYVKRAWCLFEVRDCWYLTAELIACVTEVHVHCSCLM
jgi:hypothetical protein